MDASPPSFPLLLLEAVEWWRSFQTPDTNQQIERISDQIRKNTNDFYVPVFVNLQEKDPDITYFRHNEQIFQVPWHFAILRVPSIRQANIK